MRYPDKYRIGIKLTFRITVVKPILASLLTKPLTGRPVGRQGFHSDKKSEQGLTAFL
jgi:hypothetical protein